MHRFSHYWNEVVVPVFADQNNLRASPELNIQIGDINDFKHKLIYPYSWIRACEPY